MNPVRTIVLTRAQFDALPEYPETCTPITTGQQWKTWAAAVAGRPAEWWHGENTERGVEWSRLAIAPDPVAEAARLSASDPQLDQPFTRRDALQVLAVLFAATVDGESGETRGQTARIFTRLGAAVRGEPTPIANSQSAELEGLQRVYGNWRGSAEEHE